MTEKVAPPAGVHLIQTPTFFPGVPTVNSYLIEGPLTLVDGGLQTPDAWKAFSARLKELGFRPEDIRRVLLTHGHPDHFGLAQKIHELSGAEIYAGEFEAAKISTPATQRAEVAQGLYRDFCLRLGVPEEVFAALKSMSELNRQFAPPVTAPIRPLRHGDRIPFDRFELEVLYTPGHTLGIVCYWEPQSRAIFSSDHLLEEISPNPVLELGAEGEKNFDNKFRSLVSYMDEMTKLRGREIACVMPGHGLPFRGHDEVIGNLLNFYSRRQLKIWNILKETGPIVLHELGKKVFPKAGGLEGFLVAGELLGNLEVMELSNSTLREFDGTHYLYRAGPDHPREWPFS